MQSLDKKTKTVKAIYCCYDLFSKTDVRVEVSYPGSSQAYALGETKDKRYSVDWPNTYLSAQLRQFRAEPCYVCRVISNEPGPAQLKDLMAQVRQTYTKKIFPQCDFDKLRYGPSLLLYEMTQRMLKT